MLVLIAIIIAVVDSNIALAFVLGALYESLMKELS